MRCTYQEYLPLAYGEVFYILRVNMVTSLPVLLCNGCFLSSIIRSEFFILCNSVKIFNPSSEYVSIPNRSKKTSTGIKRIFDPVLQSTVYHLVYETQFSVSRMQTGIQEKLQEGYSR